MKRKAKQAQGGDGLPDNALAGEAAKHAKRFRDRYPAVQYHFVEFITEHLADCSRTFGGDLAQVVILAIIGQVFLHAHLDRDKKGVSTLPVGGTGIGASRIADITSIPRETVRRKLAELARRGWIERLGSGWRLRMVGGEAAARGDLAALDSRGLDRLAQLHAALSSLR